MHMAYKTSAEQPKGSAIIANRYRVQRTLGQGGMAVVYQVLDATTGEQLALKRLTARGDEEKQEQISALFECEFHTLAQLAHPRVIEVYDYGRDDEGPYYTMELLEGGDLKKLAPLPWKKACSLLSDVCSALSLLHSRRQIHRDLTTRNIRCTRDEKAKLIDFGAMVPMGPSKQVVGTPAFAAPEVATLQTLDARTDLYSLGAALYYALTRRHAYPAKSFEELRDVWRSAPHPPSSYVEDIPKELDNLVLSLISLDPMARPMHAAEVMERLSAIAGHQMDDALLVSRAHLSTPTLVGREEAILGVRKRVVRAFRGSGSTLVVEGDSGAGRSRFLDACVLEGKLAGAIVLRADASDGRAGDWGAISAMASQLVRAAPQLARKAAEPHASILGHVLPELLTRPEREPVRLSFRPAQPAESPFAESDAPAPDPSAEVWARGNSWRPPPIQTEGDIAPCTFDDPQQLRPRVQAALRDWLLQVSSHQCLLLAVDDVHRIDEPSAAFLALLAHRIYQRMVVMAVTAETGASSSSPVALRLLRDAGRHVSLSNLNPEHTEALLRSVFGEVPNVGLLADRVQSVSQGNPRAVMQLTQHLVDQGLVRYQAGAWTLPSAIDTADLPSSLSEALKARVRKLSAAALELAQTMALSPEHSFDLEECLLLAGHRDTALLIRTLDELVAAQVLSTDAEHYSFGQRGWVAALTDELEDERKRALHVRLAEMFDKRGDEQLRVAHHLLNAGAEERALDAILEHLKTFRDRLAQTPQALSDYLKSLPRQWVHTLESLLDACEKLGRPKKQRHVMQSFLAHLSAVGLEANKAHLGSVIEQLIQDSGLGPYRELGDSVEPSERLGRALELAQQRYDSCPESERVLPPVDAIRDLAQAIITGISFFGPAFDHSLVSSLPSLKPLIPLSGALDIVERNVHSTTHIVSGRYEQARQGYLEILEQLAQPDRSGLDEHYHRYTRLTMMYTVGMIEASLGLRSTLQWVDELDADPLFQVNAWRIRTVYYLRQGDFQKAEECKKQAELLQIQNSPSQFFEGTQLFPEIMAYASSDDLARANQTIDDLAHMAARFEGWVPILHFARAEYQRIRGDFESALAETEKGLTLAKPGRSVVWPFLAATHVNTLSALGRLGEAQQVGRGFLEAAERENLGVLRHYIGRAVALVEAKVGEHDEALRRIEAAIDDYKAKGMGGLNLGLGYETRARVAISMNDYEGFKTYARICAEQFRAGQNPVLTAKYEKLMQEARQANFGVSEELANAADVTQLTAETALGVVGTVMGDCKSPAERAQRALELLVKQGNCSGGFLYTVQKKGLVLSARDGESAPSAEVETIVQRHLLAELDGADDTTITGVDPEALSGSGFEWMKQEGERYRAVLLGHETREGFAITGVAVLLLEQDELFNFPGKVVTAVSKALLDAGDVVRVCATG